MQNTKIHLILSFLSLFLLVLAAAGTVSAISLEIELPESAAPGETVTGTIWIKNAGDVEKNLTSYQVHLLGDASLGITMDSSEALNIGYVSYTSAAPTVIMGGYTGMKYYSIDPLLQKLCNFTLTIPSAAVLGTTYAVNFTSVAPWTYLMSYTTYHFDGSGQSTSHGNIPGAVLSTVNATVTVTNPVVSHTVTFYNETGTVYTTSSVQDGNQVTRPADPVKTGYSFNSWNVSSPSGYPYVFTTPVYDDLDLYANWSVNTYSIIYNQPSHGVVSGDSSAVYGATVTVTATPDSGYQFANLVVTKSGESASVSSTGTTFVMPAFAVNVTATFTAISPTPTPTPTPTPSPVPTYSPSSGGGNKGATQIISAQTSSGQNTVDISAQYAGQNFISIDVFEADIAAIRAAYPILAAELEAKIARAETAGIELTNNNGAPALVSYNLENPVLDYVTFSRVYDISSTDSNVKLTQVTVTVPKSAITSAGLTANDVTIYHNLATYDLWVPLDTLQVTEDAANYYYTAATDGASPFGVLIKRFDDSPAIPTTNPTAQQTTTSKSPAPVVGLIAGLGAATVLLRLRK